MPWPTLLPPSAPAPCTRTLPRTCRPASCPPPPAPPRPPRRLPRRRRRALGRAREGRRRRSRSCACCASCAPPWTPRGTACSAGRSGRRPCARTSWCVLLRWRQAPAAVSPPILHHGGMPAGLTFASPSLWLAAWPAVHAAHQHGPHAAAPRLAAAGGVGRRGGRPAAAADGAGAHLAPRRRHGGRRAAAACCSLAARHACSRFKSGPHLGPSHPQGSPCPSSPLSQARASTPAWALKLDLLISFWLLDVGCRSAAEHAVVVTGNVHSL